MTTVKQSQHALAQKSLKPSQTNKEISENVEGTKLSLKDMPLKRVLHSPWPGLQTLRKKEMLAVDVNK